MIQNAYMAPTRIKQAKRPALPDWPKYLIYMVGRVGLEPTTKGL